MKQKGYHDKNGPEPLPLEVRTENAQTYYGFGNRGKVPPNRDRGRRLRLVPNLTGGTLDYEYRRRHKQIRPPATLLNTQHIVNKQLCAPVSWIFREGRDMPVPAFHKGVIHPLTQSPAGLPDLNSSV